ncbi:hypothetical protein TNCV_4192711 [Trichonephila clavipes]|nr:hypothetical protein TNCV_4192711 [Trichonephila clavipes]
MPSLALSGRTSPMWNRAKHSQRLNGYKMGQRVSSPNDSPGCQAFGTFCYDSNRLKNRSFRKESPFLLHTVDVYRHQAPNKPLDKIGETFKAMATRPPWPRICM